MDRDLFQTLTKWRSHPLRKPLILHGARQVGKSWLAKCLGETFPNFIQINFEKQKSAKTLFMEDLNIETLMQNIELYTQQKCTPGSTLLFLDEIQECPDAIKALRYFKEDLPELHVLAAGSLLPFTLEKIGVGVGRLQFLYVHPLSFAEFLLTQDRADLRAHLKSHKKIHPTIHQQLLGYIKTYTWLGGMPAVLSAWQEHHDGKLCQEVQEELITTYQKDFAKYARQSQFAAIEKVFHQVPHLLGKKFKYTAIDRDLRAVVLKNVLDLLVKAGIVHLAYHTSAQGLPLAAMRNERHFKAFFFDIGLAQRMLGLDLKSWLLAPLDVTYLGEISEQFVAQEYIAYTAIKSAPELYYWHREEKISTAEVDFVFLKNQEIIPVEVKASSKGHLKSLQAFLNTHPNTQYGLKISQHPYHEEPQLHTIPFYGLEAWLSTVID